MLTSQQRSEIADRHAALPQGPYKFGTQGGGINPDHFAVYANGWPVALDIVDENVARFLVSAQHDVPVLLAEAEQFDEWRSTAYNYSADLALMFKALQVSNIKAAVSEITRLRREAQETWRDADATGAGTADDR